MAINLLIAGLPAEEQSRLKPFFERVELTDGEDLVRAGNSLDFIWFIESGVIFTSQPIRNRRPIPAGLAGNEGVAGFELWLGRNTSPLSTVAEVGGDALRMSADDLQREVLSRHSALNQALGDYVFNFVTMGAQLAACLLSHSPEERLWSRTLLCSPCACLNTPASSNIAITRCAFWTSKGCAMAAANASRFSRSGSLDFKTPPAPQQRAPERGRTSTICERILPAG